MKTALDPRHQKRQKVVQELFSWDAQEKSNAPHNPELNGLTDTAQKIIENQSAIDALIGRNAPEREISQINQIDLAILRLAIYEITFSREAPAKAMIDEAVELAKEFGNESSPQFVNGVLGNVFVDSDRITLIIADRLGVDPKILASETKLEEELNVTPLEVADLLTFLETELHINIPEGTKCETVGDILDAVEEAKI